MRPRSQLRRSDLFAFLMPCSGLRHAFVTPSETRRWRSCKSLTLPYLLSDSPVDCTSVKGLYCGSRAVCRGSSGLIRLDGFTVARVHGTSGDVFDRVRNTHGCMSILCSRALARNCFPACLSLWVHGLQVCSAGACEDQPPSNLSLELAVGYFLDDVGQPCLTLAAPRRVAMCTRGRSDDQALGALREMKLRQFLSFRKCAHVRAACPSWFKLCPHARAHSSVWRCCAKLSLLGTRTHEHVRLTVVHRF